MESVGNRIMKWPLWLFSLIYCLSAIFMAGYQSLYSNKIFFMCAFVLSIVAYFCLVLERKNFVSKKSLMAMTFIIVASASLATTNWSSTDPDYYIAHITNYEKFHLNPYAYSTDKAISEGFTSPSAQKVTGLSKKTPFTYGYLWLGVLDGLYKSTEGNAMNFLLLLKLFNMVLLFLLYWGIVKILETLKLSFSKSEVFVLLLMNPILLQEVIVNSHNDILNILLLVLCLYFLLKNRPTLALIVLTGAIQVKMNIIFWLPLVCTYIFWNSPKSDRFKNLAPGLGFFLLSWALYPLIFNVNGIPPGLLQYNSGNVNTFSLIVIIFLNLFFVYLPYGKTLLPSALEKMSDAVTDKALSFFKIAWIATYGYILYIFSRRRSDFIALIKVGTFVYILYCLVFSNIFWSWYFLWVIPFFVVLMAEPEKINKVYTMVLAAYIFMVVVLGGVLFEHSTLLYLVATLLLITFWIIMFIYNRRCGHKSSIKNVFNYFLGDILKPLKPEKRDE